MSWNIGISLGMLKHVNKGIVCMLLNIACILRAAIRVKA
jgi:hypothetical protein